MAFDPLPVARIGDRGLKLRVGAIRRVELYRLHADGRSRGTGLIGGNAAIPTGLAPGT